MKIHKIIFVTPIIILIAIILNIALDSINTETFTPSINSKFGNVTKNEHDELSSNNLYSGPFAIFSGTYGVDDTVFLIGSEIPMNSKGEILFIRPDGKIHHKLSFDGSKSAVNHYFTPVKSSDLEECKKCEFFGIWEISFKSFEGKTYDSIQFRVEKNLEN